MDPNQHQLWETAALTLAVSLYAVYFFFIVFKIIPVELFIAFTFLATLDYVRHNPFAAIALFALSPVIPSTSSPCSC